MHREVLARLLEHNNWANARLIEECAALGAGQLDAHPQPGSDWSIRHTLTHLVSAQRGYLALLTLPVEARRHAEAAFEELDEVARTSGEGLLAWARQSYGPCWNERLQTMDGYLVEPWVVLLQVINHATEHRKQIGIMLRALGVTPPSLDGWGYGEVTNALVPQSR